MNKQPEEHPKTSRRRFTKSVVTAMLAAPVASSLVTAGESVVVEAEPTPQGFLEQRNQHDTPPPTIITQGSLVLEMDKAFGAAMTAGGKKTYKRPKQTKPADLDHIKIVDGSGEMLYRNDKAINCDVIVALGTSATPPEVKVSGGNELAIEIPDSMDLGSPSATGNVRRPQKYQSGALAITSITVKRASAVVFSVTQSDVVSKLEDVRIMLWHKDH